jgi:molybdenum cofactor cytidylyltransferase
MMVAGLILAGGQGKRVGGVKPLLVHEGATLLERVVQNFRVATLDPLIVVLGFEARRVIQRIPLGGLKVVINPQPSLGISSSIQRGLAHISPRCKAVMVALGDMPLVTTETVNLLVAEFNKGKKGIVVPVHGNQQGHPVIFDVKYLDDLLALRGDKGAKSVLEAHPKDIQEVKVDSDEVLIDIDTHEDWEMVKDRLELRQPMSSPA